MRPNGRAGRFVTRTISTVTATFLKAACTFPGMIGSSIVRCLSALALSDHPGEIVHLVCDKGGRSGRRRKDSLIARFGADIALPDPRQEIALRTSDEHARSVRSPRWGDHEGTVLSVRAEANLGRRWITVEGAPTAIAEYQGRAARNSA